MVSRGNGYSLVKWDRTVDNAIAIPACSILCGTLHAHSLPIFPRRLWLSASYCLAEVLLPFCVHLELGTTQLRYVLDPSPQLNCLCVVRVGIAWESMISI